jgi:hypothetical protein
VTLKTERHHHDGSAHAAFNACIGHVHGLSYGRSWTFTTTTAPTLPRLRYHLNLVFNTISRALTVGWVHFCVPKTVGMRTFFYSRLHKMSVLEFGMFIFPVLGTQKCTLPISTYVTSTGRHWIGGKKGEIIVVDEHVLMQTENISCNFAKQRKFSCTLQEIGSFLFCFSFFDSVIGLWEKGLDFFSAQY